MLIIVCTLYSEDFVSIQVLCTHSIYNLLERPDLCLNHWLRLEEEQRCQQYETFLLCLLEYCIRFFLAAVHVYFHCFGLVSDLVDQISQKKKILIINISFSILNKHLKLFIWFVHIKKILHSCFWTVSDMNYYCTSTNQISDIERYLDILKCQFSLVFKVKLLKLFG